MSRATLRRGRRLRQRDRAEIEDVLLRYCRGIDRCDADLLRSAYHDDAHDDHGVFAGSPDAFVAWALQGLLAKEQITTHLLTNVLIEPESRRRARCESYFIGTHVADENDQTHIAEFHGRYVDVLERRAGIWAIAARRTIYDWTEKRRIARVHAAGDPRFDHGRRSRSDPVYADDATS